MNTGLGKKSDDYKGTNDKLGMRSKVYEQRTEL
jgi:hypothetical protein